MNVFGLDIDKIDSQDIAAAIDKQQISYNKLPGVPSILSRDELAAVSGVSIPTIERLIASGALNEVNLPGGDTGIIKDEFIAFVDANLLCNRPLIT